MRPVFDPDSLKRLLVPIESRFEGFKFPTPTLPDVTSEFSEFVNWTVLAVVFPYPMTWSKVAETWVETILVMRPDASTTIWGIAVPDPYVAAVVAPATFERKRADP